MFDRIIKMIGDEKFTKIQNSSVAIIGLGGVGGYAVEALVRSGIQNFILVDYDIIALSNLNRQIISTTSNISSSKVNAMEERILSINKSCHIEKINIKLTPLNLEELFKYKFDYLIDACDTVEVKMELIKTCLEKNIKIISSMGMGNKLKMMDLEITDIWKTSYDPIAKKIRKYLRENNIKAKVPVVYSKEKNPSFTGDVPSMIFVPATGGLLLANYVIMDILEDKKEL